MAVRLGPPCWRPSSILPVFRWLYFFFFCRFNPRLDLAQWQISIFFVCFSSTIPTSLVQQRLRHIFKRYCATLFGPFSRKCFAPFLGYCLRLSGGWKKKRSFVCYFAANAVKYYYDIAQPFHGMDVDAKRFLEFNRYFHPVAVFVTRGILFISHYDWNINCPVYNLCYTIEHDVLESKQLGYRKLNRDHLQNIWFQSQ